MMKCHGGLECEVPPQMSSSSSGHGSKFQELSILAKNLSGHSDRETKYVTCSSEGIPVDMLNLILQYENNIEGMISVSKSESEIWRLRDMDTQKWRMLQISKARLKMHLPLRPVMAALHKRALIQAILQILL
ncbi:hypothetical protein AVEN_17223-1 [Araneus ventricosus]|uniref:Uncharacterized protein n=1 Tax=Araneus ventricosus TaxID=182803 RepID=A0A4Y2U2T7_ARAVE|nr:hypothetical protein AVEN_17223-1 [Araneus ventricosus]